MFTKLKPVRDINVRGRQYKKVIDWEAVGGAIILAVLAVLALNAFIG